MILRKNIKIFGKREEKIRAKKRVIGGIRVIEGHVIEGEYSTTPFNDPHLTRSPFNAVFQGNIFIFSAIYCVNTMNEYLFMF